MDRHDLDLFASDPVDDAVVSENDLPDSVTLQFWNNPPHARVLDQAVCGVEGATSKYRRNVRCVASNEEADRLKVIESLERPSYLSHFAIRWRASS